MLVTPFYKQEAVIKIEVKDNNVDQALRILKRKLQREGFFKILKIKSNYEKPSERKKREKSENIKRSKKLQRMRKNS
jgi:small subunit ribosomal protein S21